MNQHSARPMEQAEEMCNSGHSVRRIYRETCSCGWRTPWEGWPSKAASLMHDHIVAAGDGKAIILKVDG